MTKTWRFHPNGLTGDLSLRDIYQVVCLLSLRFICVMAALADIPVKSSLLKAPGASGEASAVPDIPQSMPRKQLLWLITPPPRITC